MICPYCEKDNDKVIDSRPAEGGKSIRRRRVCLACGGRFTTYERPEMSAINIFKKDGTFELFDKDKLYRNILKACHKRPISEEAIRSLVSEVECSLRNKEERVSSKDIGEAVMEHLAELDKVAYLRFASVYKAFDNPEAFTEAVNKLLQSDAEASKNSKIF